MSLSPKQIEYLKNCNHRWNIKVGATGSGKSWLDYAVVIPQRMLAAHKEGANVLLGNTQGTIIRNIIEPMREIWGEHLVSALHSDNTVDLFGKSAYVLGADSRKHVARIQGMTIEYAYGDEMTTWDESVFQMLKSRLRCKHSVFDGTCNPDNPTHFLKQFIDSDFDIYCQTSVIDDNPFLPPEFVANLKQEYEGTVYYDRFILGKWTRAEGIIYDMFDRKKHVVASADRPYTVYYISMDYGTLNPTAMLLWGKFDGKWYQVDEYYYSGRDSNRQKTDEEYYSELVNLIGSRSIRAVIIDPSAASMIACIKRHGKFTVIPADNAVQDGIRDTATELNAGRLLICDRCKNTIAEYEAYSWDGKASAKGEDKPIKENDHAMDATRYFIHTIVKRPKAKVANRYMLGIY